MVRLLCLAVFLMVLTPPADARAEVFPREVVLESGEVLEGHLVESTATELTLLLADGRFRTLRWEDVLSLRALDGVHGPTVDAPLLQPWTDKNADWRRGKELSRYNRVVGRSGRALRWSIAPTVPLMSTGILINQVAVATGATPPGFLALTLNATSISFAAVGSRLALDALDAPPTLMQAWGVGLVMAISGAVHGAIAPSLRGSRDFDGYLAGVVNGAVGTGLLIAGNVVMMSVAGAARVDAGAVAGSPTVLPYASASNGGAAFGIAGLW